MTPRAGLHSAKFAALAIAGAAAGVGAFAPAGVPSLRAPCAVPFHYSAAMCTRSRARTHAHVHTFRALSVARFARACAPRVRDQLQRRLMRATKCMIMPGCARATAQSAATCVRQSIYGNAGEAEGQYRDEQGNLRDKNGVCVCVCV